MLVVVVVGGDDYVALAVALVVVSAVAAAAAAVEVISLPLHCHYQTNHRPLTFAPSTPSLKFMIL